MLETHLRPPTPAERDRLRAISAFSSEHVLWVILLTVITPWSLGYAIEWGLRLLSVHIDPYLRLALGIAGVAAGAAWLWRDARARRALRQVDEVEELRVEDPFVVEADAEALGFPCYVMRVGPETLLLLAGQYLAQGSTYGGLDAEVDAFPCQAFTLVRVPGSGEVLHIEPRGPRLEPAWQLPSREIPYFTEESAVMPGGLAAVDEAIEVHVREQADEA